MPKCLAPPFAQILANDFPACALTPEEEEILAFASEAAQIYQLFPYCKKNDLIALIADI